MRRVYLDNAATTPMANEVWDVMIPMMQNQFGNPSSTHAFGREVKGKLELSRKKIAELLKTTPGEIIFTSGGTEADNMAINCAINDLGCKHIITTPIEHHAVLHTVEDIAEKGKAKLSFVRIDKLGHLDLEHLEELLENNEKTFVSLMHANNEIGTLTPLKKVSEICRKHNAIFHSDTVQTMGHYQFNLSELDIDFLTCAGHKFHGPKGVGFLYVNKKVSFSPLIHGGSQERNRRGGTENVYGIVGLAKALEIANEDVEEHQNHVQGLKSYMIKELENRIEGVQFNGDAKGTSLYTVLNVSLPPNPKSSMLLFQLDLMGIAASGGSACSSGSNKGSHVLTGINADSERPAVRFSFSRYTTKEDVDYCLDKLCDIYLS